MNDIFTTRELAIGIWALAFLIWASLRPDVRKSFVGVLRAACHWKLLVPFVLVAGYMAVVVQVLYWAGIWTPDLLKDTVLWFLFSGVVLAFSSFQTDNQVSIWRRAFSDQVKVIILVEYLVNTYTFSLWIELGLTPLLVLLVMIDTIAKSEAQFAVVSKLTSWIQIFIGLVILAFAIHYAFSSRAEFSALDAMRTIILVPILSGLLMPCMYFLSLLSAYEQLFLRLKIGPQKDRDVVLYAERKLLTHLGLRPRRVCEFTRAHVLDLMRIANRSDVDRLIAQPSVDKSGTFTAS